MGRNFFTDREKYLVSKSKNQKFIAEVKEFGKSERLLYCGSLADDVKEANTYLFGFGALRCQSEEGGHYNAYLNVEYLKIIVSSHGGYGVLGNNNSPFLGIGSCFPLYCSPKKYETPNHISSLWGFNKIVGILLGGFSVSVKN